MEDHQRRRHHRCGCAATTRRLRYILGMAGDYLKYLFMKRRRLLHRVARRTLALVVHRHGGERKNHHLNHMRPWPPRALMMEREFSCADSPSPAFLAAKRLLLRSRLRGGGAAAAAADAVSSCFGSFRAPSCGSPAVTTAAAALETEASSEEEDEEDRQLETTTTEDEEEDDDQAADGWLQCGELLDDVDDRAEEFINMFYEQLRAQSFAAAVFQSMTKLQRQHLSMGKLSSAVRDLLVFMPRKKPMLGVGLVVVAKCRELWEGLTAVACRPPANDDDYFRGSYEFSCTATPINVLFAPVNGRPRRRQRRRLPPCVGGKQAREMLAGRVDVTPRDGGWSPEPEPECSPQAAMGGPDIDGLAEEFIQRFHEQLRMQVDYDDDDARPKSRLATYHV
ncbi:hypothetical protein U9M48_023295 [Paspalum notatum var. saurae]|uniref:Uncharacterized protein n=1 Tax=Paspalum notatum var. saurae TaxID=547442 RepID=A0AAQ3TLN7_PASNO